MIAPAELDAVKVAPGVLETLRTALAERVGAVHGELLAQVGVDALIAAGFRVTVDPTATLTALNTLTEGEWRVLRWLSLGLSNGQIAGRLGIAPKTVKSHAASIYSKLGTSSRAETVALIHGAAA
jgi:DNA-binding NarL/FixJ family response regulator